MNSARQSIHGSPNKICWQDRMVHRFFRLKRQTCFLQRKINHSREHHILEKQYTHAKGNLPCNQKCRAGCQHLAFNEHSGETSGQAETGNKSLIMYKRLTHASVLP